MLRSSIRGTMVQLRYMALLHSLQACILGTLLGLTFAYIVFVDGLSASLQVRAWFVLNVARHKVTHVDPPFQTLLLVSAHTPLPPITIVSFLVSFHILTLSFRMWRLMKVKLAC